MILITGCGGFIGKHFLRLAIENYGTENIVAFTSYPIKDCKYLLHKNYDFEKDYFIKEGLGNISKIVHIGAFTPKNSAEADNITKSNSNIYNTYMLASANLPNLEKIIFLSTLDVYESSNFISEATQELPSSLYGYSKLYCEKMLEKWASENKKQLQILRIGHVYGPGEEEYIKIIPETIKKILKKEELKIWGTGNDIRSFIYIKDVIQAILNAIELKENIGVVNIVGNQAITINELVHKIIKISGYQSSIQHIETQSKPRSLTFDNSKLLKFLLKEEIPLDEGLEQEFRYFQKKYENNF